MDGHQKLRQFAKRRPGWSHLVFRLLELTRPEDWREGDVIVGMEIQEKHCAIDIAGARPLQCPAYGYSPGQLPISLLAFSCGQFSVARQDRF